MTTIAPSRSLIQQEETDYRSGVSEAAATRIGALNNHNAEKLYSVYSFHLNGFYSLGAGSTGTDGVFGMAYNIRIIGFLMYSNQSGSSGITTIDIRRITGGGIDAGSIFSTLPEVDSTSANGSVMFLKYNTEDNTETVIHQPTGYTKPVFTGFDYNQGDVLRMDLNAAMLGAEGLQVSLMYIPIDGGIN